MANTLQATTAFYVRAGGDELNGGGFNSATAGGTNWANQDAAHVVIDDVTITGDAAGAGDDVVITGYTVATTDVGNIVRIESGTNAVAGYYEITAVNTGTSTWTLARHQSASPFTGACSDLVAKMGGAWADFRNFAATGSVLPAPIISNPIPAGSIVYWDGGGYANPTYAQVLYDYSAGYWTWGAVNTSTVAVVGINGRPGYKMMAGGSWPAGWEMVGSVGYAEANLTAAIFNGSTIKCDFDMRGYTSSTYGFAGFLAQSTRIINSGAAGSSGGAAMQGSVFAVDCVVEGWGSNGYFTNGGGQVLVNCVASGCNGSGFVNYLGTYYKMVNCTSDSNVQSGFYCNGAQSELINCVLSNNTRYGIEGDANLIKGGNNNIYNNTLGPIIANTNYKVTQTDIATNPAFADAANYDWRSTAMLGLGHSANGSSNTPIGAQYPGYIDETTRNTGTAAGNILSGNSIKIATVTTNGTFDEAARNVGVAANKILTGNSIKIQNVDTAGTFDEAARNIGVTADKILAGNSIKIQNVDTTGTFDESSRNTDPAEANVRSGSTYKIANASKTGALVPGSVSIG